MRHEFTPAAERALLAAAGWASCADRDELHLPEVLIGLLAEPECRAALLLARCDVDPQVVHRKFPELVPSAKPPAERACRFSSELLACLDAVDYRLAEHPRPLSLATEHVLLALLSTQNEVANWLADCGLKYDLLEQEVHRLAGHRPGPLPLESDDDSATSANGEIESSADIATPPAKQSELLEAPLAEKLTELRILDAAANRAGEGLRVIEDYLRLALDDRHLTSLCKAIRHQLASVLVELSSPLRHAARDTQADVGTGLTLGCELDRAGITAVVDANFKRVEQSLRSLEEFSKISTPSASAVFKELRYRVYTLERIVGITRTSRDRLSAANLCVLIDGGTSSNDFRARARALVAAGVPMIQLRDKRLPDRQLLERARQLVELTRDSDTLSIINDRPDLASLAGADGVHVGQDDMHIKDARRIVGPGALVGVSTHSIDQVRAAVLDGASYIGVGPTFPSGTKSFDQFPGSALLQAVQAEITLPAFAIGGITLENLGEVLASGFTRIAVSGSVATAADPQSAARQLLNALDQRG